MSKLQDLVNQHNTEYARLFLQFAVERDLPLDVDMWPAKTQDEWFTTSDELTQKLDEASKKLRDTPLDEREDADWYMIDITIDTVDGPEYETIDIRKVPLERLKNICKMFPKYNDYYFEKASLIHYK